MTYNYVITLHNYRIGSILVPCVKKYVSNQNQVTLKWPNDILINNQKVIDEVKH